MKKQYLISFCNNSKKIDYQTGHGIIGLLELGVENQPKFRPISINLPFLSKIKGATGLVKRGNSYFVVLQSATPVLLELDPQFKVLNHTFLDGLKGVHSVRFYEDKLLLVSTRQDKIVSYDFNGTFTPIYDLGTDSDTHHFNSICIHQNRILASAFGINKKEFWTLAEGGYVIDVMSKEVIMEGLKQPHSLFSYNDELFVCDSSRQRVIDQQFKQVASSERGYVRGLCLHDDWLLFGVSKGRSISNSTGKYIGNISNQGILAGVCQVVAQAKGGEVSTISLEAAADEVYDIIQC